MECNNRKEGSDQAGREPAACVSLPDCMYNEACVGPRAAFSSTAERPYLESARAIFPLGISISVMC